jgi:hypothetical protein
VELPAIFGHFGGRELIVKPTFGVGYPFDKVVIIAFYRVIINERRKQLSAKETDYVFHPAQV